MKSNITSEYILYSVFLYEFQNQKLNLQSKSCYKILLPRPSSLHDEVRADGTHTYFLTHSSFL